MNSIRLLMEQNGLNEESAQYSVNQINQSKFIVQKNGESAYTLEKKQSKWVCDCPGFKYRKSCKHLEMIKDFLPKRHDRATITNAVRDIMPKLKKITPRVEIVGSYRRGSKDSKDIDILMDCSAADFKKVVGVLESYENYKPVMAGDNIIRGYCDGIEMDINRLSENMNYYLALEYRTGPYEHNIAMRVLAKKLNGSLSENELVVQGRNIRVTSEKDIYEALGVEYQPPEKRSDNLKYTKIKDIGCYRAVNGSKDLGAAPARAYAKGQVKQIRELCKLLPKSFTLADEWKQGKFELRFTVSEKEIENVKDKYEIKSPTGDLVKMNRYELKIKPVLKLDGQRIKLGDTVKINGSKIMVYDLVISEFQKLINKKMRLPVTPVGKLCNNILGRESFPVFLDYKTVCYPVEGVK